MSQPHDRARVTSIGADSVSPFCFSKNIKNYKVEGWETRIPFIKNPLIKTNQIVPTFVQLVHNIAIHIAITGDISQLIYTI